MLGIAEKIKERNRGSTEYRFEFLARYSFSASEFEFEGMFFHKRKKAHTLWSQRWHRQKMGEGLKCFFVFEEKKQ